MNPNLPPTVLERALTAVSGAPDKLDMVIRDNHAFCPECDNIMGEVKGRNLHCATLIVVNRLVCRCSRCRRKLVWKPIELDKSQKLM